MTTTPFDHLNGWKYFSNSITKIIVLFFFIRIGAPTMIMSFFLFLTYRNDQYHNALCNLVFCFEHHLGNKLREFDFFIFFLAQKLCL